MKNKTKLKMDQINFLNSRGVSMVSLSWVKRFSVLLALMVCSGVAHATPGIPEVTIADSFLSGGRLQLSWESTGGTTYQIQESLNGGSYKQVKTVTQGSNSNVNVTLVSQPYTYIRGTTSEIGRHREQYESGVYVNSLEDLSFGARNGDDLRYRVRACTGTRCSGWSPAQSRVMQYRDNSTLTVQKDVYDKDSYAINWRLPVSEILNTINKNKLTGYGFVCSRPEYLQNISTTFNYTLQERKLPDGGWQNIATKNSGNVIPSMYKLNTVVQGHKIKVTSYNISRKTYNGANFSHTVTGRDVGEYNYRLVKTARVDDNCQKIQYFQRRIPKLFIYTRTTVEDVKPVIVHAPQAPTQVSSPPAFTVSGEYSVSWNQSTSPGDKYYELQESKVENLSTIDFKTIYTGEALTINRLHETSGNARYRVRACYDAGCGEWSQTIKTDIVEKPLPIESIQFLSDSNTNLGFYSVDNSVLSAGDFRMFFSSPANVARANVTSYRIRVSKNGGVFKNLEEVSSRRLPYEFSLGNYRQYYWASGVYRFQVQACNEACGCGEFVTSDRSVRIVDLPGKPVKPVASPLNSEGNIKLDWNVPSGLMVSHYEVKQSPGLLMNTGRRSSHFQLTSGTSISMDRTPGSYYYQVRGCSLAGCGQWSNYSDRVTVHPPGTPTNFTIDSSHKQSESSFADQDGSYTVMWHSYKHPEIDITYKLTETNDQGPPIVHEQSESSFTVSSQVEGNYTYQLQACIKNSDRCGDPTRQISIEVVSMPTVPVWKAESLEKPEGSTIQLDWHSSESATYYQVEQKIGNGEAKLLADQGAQTSRQISLELNGTNSYTYKVRACNGNSSFDLCSAFSEPRSVVAEAKHSIAQPPLPQLGFAPSQPDSSDAVGSLSGEFRVSESGAATYQISIDTAPGTAGVTPSMGLTYSSQGGNGIAGQGWNLTGASSISRCRSTLSQDTYALPITWSENDKFCLDGQRLLVVNDKEYGEQGAIYRTEVDTYAEVTSVGGDDGHPDHFKVTRKDGSVSFYGKPTNTAGSISNSKLYLGSNVFTWGINEFSDSVGNKITFNYENEDNNQYIKEIGYAYGAGETPNAKIKYFYEDRPDPIKIYVSGESQSVTKRLSHIESYNESVLLRQYNLNYDVSNQLNAPSRLTSIQMCTDGGVCLPETRFDWITSSGGKLPSGRSLRQEVESFVTDEIRNSYLGDVKFGDINGDGFTDIIYTTTYFRVKKRFFKKPKIRSHQRLQYLINTGNSFVKGEDFYYPDSYEEPLKLQTLDYNGDGRTDVLVKSSQSGGEHEDDARWHIYLANATGAGQWGLQRDRQETFPFKGDDVAFADMNSDGLSDAFDGKDYWLLEQDDSSTPIDVSSKTPYRYKTKKRISYKQNFDWSSRFVANSPNTWGNTRYYSGEDAGVKSPAGDINGDGIGDFLIQSYGYQVALSLVKDGELTFVPARRNAPKISDHSVTQFADFNSDGLTDIIYWQKLSNTSTRGWRVQLSTGTGFTSPIVINDIVLDLSDLDDDYEQTDAAEDNRVQVVDVNNDGYTDIVWQTNSKLRVRHWDQNQNTFGRAVNLRSISTDEDVSERQQHIFADFNGDIVTDYVLFTGSDQKNGVRRYDDLGNLYDFYYAQGDNAQNLAANNIGNVVKRITNGLGAETNLNYERLSLTDAYMQLEPEIRSTGCVSRFGECNSSYNNDYTALNVPFGDLPEGSVSLQGHDPLTAVFISNAPTPLVTKVTSSAPTYDAHDGMSELEYGYGHAKFQAGGRGSLGFKYLSTKDVQTGVVTTNIYRQDWPFNGYPLSTQVETEGGHKLSTSKTTWAMTGFGLNDGDETNLQSKAYKAKKYGTASLGSLQVFVTQSVEEGYALENNGAEAGALMSQTATTTEQDTYGNTTMLSVDNYSYNESGIKSSVQHAKTTNVYGGSEYDKVMGRISYTTTETSRLPEQGTRTRESAYEYYGEDAGVMRGLLKKEIVEPKGDQTLKLEIEHEYDAFGNRIHSKSTGWDGKSVVTRLGKHDQYDSFGRYMQASYQTYPVIGKVKTSEVLDRNAYGSPTRVSDINGVQAYTSYSKMGVEYFTTTDIGGWSETYLSKDVIGNYCPSYASYVQISKSADGSESRECFDMLARSIRTLGLNFDGSWVATDVRYDNIGRTIYQSEPYTTVGGDQMSAHATMLEYDITGRTTKVTLPDESSGTTEYNGYQQVETNAFGHRKVQVINSLGEVIKVIDNDQPVEEGEESSEVRYYHNEEGDLVKMVDQAGNETHIAFDKLSRKIGMTDPDKGTWSYKYNAFGEMIEQTDAKGQVIRTEFDKLGRQTKRIDYRAGGSDSDIDNTTRWFYVNQANGLGQILRVVDDKSYSMDYEYDRFGRNHKTRMKLPGLENTHESWQTYDQFGRSFQAFDASSNQEDNGVRGVQTVYNKYGFVLQTQDARTYADDTVGDSTATPVTIYNKTLEVDERGNVVKYMLGNGVIVTKKIDPKTGRLLKVQSAEPFTSLLIQDLSYSWDVLGNLTSRLDSSGTKDLVEVFTYDGFNRLKSSTTSRGSEEKNSVLMTYDLMGNIKSKSDVGTYAYDQTDNAGPHAVTKAGDATYLYDVNGNNTEGDGRTLSYSVFDKVVDVSRGEHRTTFAYGPDRSRYKRVDYVNNSEDKQTYYLGNVEYIVYANGKRQYKRQLGMVLETIEYDDFNDSVSEEIVYLLQDHLGSTDLIVDNGTIGGDDGDQRTIKILQELSFDAWGQRRDARSNDWLPFELKDQVDFNTYHTTRGYTGHEMVDGVGIIHMNGRIYDAKLARFLQADPIIQEPYATQSLNRYSYLWNNPLNATDPSGFELISLVVSAIIVASQAAAVSFIVTTAFALAQGASLGQALSAGFDAGVKTFVTSLFVPDFTGAFGGSLLGKGLASGLNGGITSVINGGKFGDGFVSSALSTGLGESKLFKVSGGATATTVHVKGVLLSGTVSELTGGKFANGAVGYASSVAHQTVSGAFSKAGQTDKAEESNSQQSSIDRINNLPDSLEERQRIYEQGKQISKEQGLNSKGDTITEKLDEINIWSDDGRGGYNQQNFKSKSKALSFLNENANSFVADGVNHGNGKITIYATATSSGTKLFVPEGGILHSRFTAGLSFGVELSGVENVIQTIAHETGHSFGYDHNNIRLYDREYRSIRDYRLR